MADGESGAADIDAAVAALLDGRVVAIPTDTVYGLAALPSARATLFELKRRPPEVHVPVLVADIEQAATVGELHPLMEAHWPGPLTVVVRRLDGEPPGTVGLRCPDDDLVRDLCRRAGPLAVTSANLHGQPTPPDATGVAALFPDIVVVDGGVRAGEPSTVVDVTGPEPVVLRQGALRL